MSLSRGKSSAMLERLTASLARELAHDGGDPSSHRPWPLPRAPWVMAQTWEDLVFLHWPMDPDDLRARLPRGLSLDTYRGDAWVSITPFVVTGLRPRGIPAVPGLSSFAETNVRTYVTRDGKPGVWFFSLDASSRLAVTAARALYHLPYHHAEFTIERTPERIRYACQRRDRHAPAGGLAVEYGPVGPRAPATSGTLSWWLTERYCLYASRRGHLYRAEIHHVPWPLQDAEAHVSHNTLLDGLAPGFGQTVGIRRPVVQFARRLSVIVWAPVRLGA